MLAVSFSCCAKLNLIFLCFCHFPVAMYCSHSFLIFFPGCMSVAWKRKGVMLSHLGKICIGWKNDIALSGWVVRKRHETNILFINCMFLQTPHPKTYDKINESCTFFTAKLNI